MQHLINRPVGAGLDNDPDDIRLVRGTLKALNGDEIIPEELSGFIDDELDADIRHFQKTSGLVEDGRLAPGGETERNLVSRITGEGIDTSAPDDAALRRSVGDGGENDPTDVIAVKRALGTLGYLKYDRTAPPSPFIDDRTVKALLDFQNDTKLLPDGRADPDGETIASLRQSLRENTGGSTPDETQIALAPALFPLFMFLGRVAPHIARSARGAAASGAVAEAARTAEQKTRNRRGGSDPESEFTMHPPGDNRLVNIPPDPEQLDGGKTVFPPKDPGGTPGKNDGKLEGRPAVPVADIPAGFPMPENPENLVVILPGRSDTPAPPLIVERKGNESTRAFNAQLARLIEKLAGKIGLRIEHIGGSRDADGLEVGETHLKNRDTGSRKGGNFIDITFITSGLRKIRIFINTVDTHADGKTLSAREERAAQQILINKEEDAILITIPKPGANETVDIDALEDLIEPLIRKLKDLSDGELDPGSVDQWIKLLEKLPTK